MKSLLILAALAPALASAVVGGKDVERFSDAAFIAQLAPDCAGTFIGGRWLLTANHCVPQLLRAVTTGYTHTVLGARVAIPVRRVVPHPDYRSERHPDHGEVYFNDFALVELEADLPDGIRAAALPGADDPSEEPGRIATLYGWGLMIERGNWQSTHLRQAEVPLVSLARANAPESYDGRLDGSMLPAGFAEGGVDACSGDSGGPLVARGDGREVLVGVVSFGYGCARPNRFGIYARVSSARAWIRETTGL